jgi:hypothetical protein
MSIRYKNQDLLMPMRIWVSRDDNEKFRINKFGQLITKFRIELPSENLTTNTNWFFDTNISSLPYWKLTQTLFVFNIACYPPVPKGCILITMSHEKTFPYNTTGLYIGSFFNETFDQFFVSTYPVTNTVPIFFWSVLDVMNNFQLQMLYNPAAKNDEALQKRISNFYTRILMYPFVEKHDYWKGTAQNFCIPCPNSEKELKFNTLSECQKKMYKRGMRNQSAWIEDRNEEIYQFMKWWEKQSSNVQIRSLTFDF